MTIAVVNHGRAVFLTFKCYIIYEILPIILLS